jgi:hypothetical protein
MQLGGWDASMNNAVLDVGKEQAARGGGMGSGGGG